VPDYVWQVLALWFPNALNAMKDANRAKITLESYG
jgi:hypothetical protein